MTLPDTFTQYTRSLMGDELYGKLLRGLADEPPVSIRINRAKCHASPEGARPVGWCTDGWYLQGRPAFTFDPLLHAGWYYVQEASSMFLHHVISQHVADASLMLDLCAAPGGKSTAALGALPDGSVLFCNEPVRQRAQILAENMQKWGRPEVVVTNSMPADYARSGLEFDVVLCDVPCSGEGMFRKDEGAIGEWSPQNVDRCAALQRQIVADAWQCLRPGGLLIYSTCTFNAKENEQNVAWICSSLGAELLPVSTDAAWAITGALSDCLAGPVYRFIPGVTTGEGLFMAVMRKRGERLSAAAPPRRRQNRQGARNRAAEYTGWIEKPEDFDFFTPADSIVAIPKRMAAHYETAARTLRIVHAGVTIGTIKGRDIIPAQSLALSVALRPGAFTRAELPYSQAIAYLRKEQLQLPEGTPRGFTLVTYGGAPLGFAKNIGPRANNLYPQEWRIKSSHAPGDDSRPAVICTDMMNDGCRQ